MSQKAIMIDKNLQALSFLLNGDCGCSSASSANFKKLTLTVKRIGDSQPVTSPIVLSEVDDSGYHTFLIPPVVRNVKTGYFELLVKNGDDVCGRIMAQKPRNCEISYTKAIYTPCNEEEFLACAADSQVAIVPPEFEPLIIKKLLVDCR